MSPEVHIEAGKSLESIGRPRAEEASLQFRAKDSLSEEIADMRGYREFQMDELATVNDLSSACFVHEKS